jgi:hypothetical protein
MMKLSTRISRRSALTGLSVLLVCLLGQIEQVQANIVLKGRYAVVLTFGANDGTGMGVVTADGNGSLQGSLLLHVPGPTEAEAVLRAQLEGQYTLNPDETGTLMLRFRLPNRIQVHTFDLVVQQADSSGVSELFGTMREGADFVPGVGATIEFKRLPETGGFNNASLGAIALVLGFESQAAIGFGHVQANGAGHLVNGVLLLNVPRPDGERRVVRGQVGGTYTVESDGMVTMDLTFSFPNGPSVQGTFDLIITEAQPSGPAKQGGSRMARKLMGSPRGFFDVFVGDDFKMFQPRPRRRVSVVVVDTWDNGSGFKQSDTNDADVGLSPRGARR